LSFPFPLFSLFDFCTLPVISRTLFHFADIIGHFAGGTPATQYAQRITQYEKRSPLFFYFIILKKSCQLSVVGCQPSAFCRPSSIIPHPSFFQSTGFSRQKYCALRNVFEEIKKILFFSKKTIHIL
jgi:hypothetical protein